VYEAGSGVHADMGFRPEVPVIALFRLMNFRVALAILVLGRGWRGDQGGVDNGTFTYLKPFSARCPLMVSKVWRVTPFASSKWQNFSSVGAACAD
jgi:hypothetical protein